MSTAGRDHSCYIMESYLLVIFVTLEQEEAIRKLFRTRGWDFKIADQSDREFGEAVDFQPPHKQRHTRIRSSTKRQSKGEVKLVHPPRKDEKEFRTKKSNVNGVGEIKENSNSVVGEQRSSSDRRIVTRSLKKTLETDPTKFNENETSSVADKSKFSRVTQSVKQEYKERLSDSRQEKSETEGITCNSKLYSKLKTPKKRKPKKNGSETRDKDDRISHSVVKGHKKNYSASHETVAVNNSSCGRQTADASSTLLADKQSFDTIYETKCSRNSTVRNCGDFKIEDNDDEAKSQASNDSYIILPDKVTIKNSATKKTEEERNVAWFPNNVAAKGHRKQKPKGEFHCSECGITYKYASAFNRHKKDGACVFICSYCGKRYTARYYSNFQLHLKYHTNSRDFVCSTCGKAFAEKSKLKVHLSCHSNKRMFVCDICGQTFNTNTILRCHIKNLHMERPKLFSCEICNRKFVTIYNLNTHKNVTHSSVRPYECKICGKAFKTKYLLEKCHMECHSVTEQIFYCSSCPKSFKKEKYLNRHMIRHKDRTHFCETCNKGFYDNKTLREHQRVHSGERPYACSLCEYKCALKGNLTKHMKTHANDDLDELSDESFGDDGEELENKTRSQEYDKRNLILKEIGASANISNFVPDIENDFGANKTIQNLATSGPVFERKANFYPESYPMLSLLNQDYSDLESQNLDADILQSPGSITGAPKEIFKHVENNSKANNVIGEPENESNRLSLNATNDLIMQPDSLSYFSYTQYQNSSCASSLGGANGKPEATVVQDNLSYFQYGP